MALLSTDPGAIAWAKLGKIGQYWAILGNIGQYWAKLGNIGQYWGLKVF